MNYDDIIHLPHHTSEKRLRMPAENRAAQFAPFSALTGHDEAIAETARRTEPLTEWDEDIQAAINRTLTEALAGNLEVTVTYFVPDQQKEGGAYRIASGHIRRVNEADRTLQMADRTVIPLGHLLDIEKKS